VNLHWRAIHTQSSERSTRLTFRPNLSEAGDNRLKRRETGAEREEVSVLPKHGQATPPRGRELRMRIPLKAVLIGLGVVVLALAGVLIGRASRQPTASTPVTSAGTGNASNQPMALSSGVVTSHRGRNFVHTSTTS